MAESRTISISGAAPDALTLAPRSAARMLVIGGIALIVAGLVFGDIFAVFVLHQNANRIGERLLAATRAVAAGNADAVTADFAAIGDSLENRGTKVDTHVHVVDFGYLALLLAGLQPYVAFDEGRKRRLAALLLTGAVMLPVGVFSIHYVGLKYSPLQSIGWASIFADFGGLLVLVAAAGMAVGLLRYARARVRRAAVTDHHLPAAQSWSELVLVAGGSLLILAGFIYGAWYSARDLYRLEARESTLLITMADKAAAQDLGLASAAVDDYGLLQAERAVKIAAHSHIIEFGLLAMLLALVQPYVDLSERWRRGWAVILLAGSVILPVCVLLELRFGLVAGGIADFGGLLVAVALLGMLAGVLRYTGRLDAQGAGP
jgi:hypothetical protein